MTSVSKIYVLIVFSLLDKECFVACDIYLPSFLIEKGLRIFLCFKPYRIQ